MSISFEVKGFGLFELQLSSHFEPKDFFAEDPYEY